ncbi:MAG: TonB-dependent receptor [Chitinophagaceae bacterium]|nr:TonB-dependent receptor [Chitinophagaceae bacterium]
MRLSLLALFVICSSVMSLFAKHVKGQEILDKKVTITFKNESLFDALERIRRVAGVQFFYATNIINPQDKVTVPAKTSTLGELLSEILDPHRLNYVVADSNKVVIRKDKSHISVASGSNIALSAPQEELTEKNIEINGRVIGASGEFLTGVTVQVKGGGAATKTDENGFFRLSVPENATLVFSYVGYKTLEVPVNRRTAIEVTLQPVDAKLDEVVVVGYATQKKASLVGAVATVNSEEIAVMPDANVASRLQGRVSGVSVTNNNSPGGTPLVRIRGFGSINNNDPLYVIDGVPTTEGLASINPNDVESMTVLKDASSSAIYGSRASNGVILITTKRGKSGTPKLTFSSRVGTQWNKNKMDVLSPAEIGEISWLQYRNDGLQVGDVNWGNPMFGYGANPVIPDYILPVGKMEGDPAVDESLYRWPRPYYGIIKANKTGTDWYDAITNSSPLIQDYNLGVTGGTEKTNYSFSFGYTNQNGILKYTGFQRYSLRSNVDAQVTNWLKIGEALGVAYTDQTGITNNNDLNPVALAARTSTMMPVTDIRGNWAGGWNPAALLYRNKDDYSKRLRVLGNAYAQATFAKHFTLKSLVGIDYNSIRNLDRNLIMYESSDAAASDVLSQSYNGGLQYNWDNTLNYNRSFGNHNLNVLGGTSVVSSFGESLTGSRSTFALTDMDYMVLDAGEKDQASSGSFDEWYTFSYFGRLNYDYQGKYLLEAVIRRDASSRFSKENRWGTFPALAVGWRLSKEAFMQNIHWITDLKIRAGYGQNGNDNVGNYNIYSTYRSNMFEAYYNISGSGTTTSQAGFRKYKLGNPNARWEATRTTDIGLDAVLFDNKIEFTFDAYTRKTTDMLYPDSKPATFGMVELPSVNIGEMQNKGFDASLLYRGKMGKDFSFVIQGNVSHYKNKVISLNGKPNEIRYGSTLRNSFYNASTAGQPISSFYGYVVEGIFNTWDEISKHPKYNPDVNGNDTYSKPGMFKYKDANGDGVITAADRTFMGSPHPDFTYGLNIDLKYKSWDLSAFFQGVQGNQLLNYLQWDNFAYINTKRSLYESWTEERYASGDKITFPIITRDVTQLHLPNSAFLENGSYFRMKSLSLGYNLSSDIAARMKLRGARIYVQTTNLFTITSYTGLDPEVTQVNNLTHGVDNGVYPTSQTFMIGLDLNL